MSDIYEYKMVQVSLEPNPQFATIESAANRWAEEGWRTVGVMPSQSPGYPHSILVERKKKKDGLSQ